MAASSFIRVAYLDNPVVTVHFSGTILTYWDVAEAAAFKHLGKRAAEDIGAGAISLRGPFTARSEKDARAALRGCDVLKLSDNVCAAVYEAWLLFEITLPGG